MNKINNEINSIFLRHSNGEFLDFSGGKQELLDFCAEKGSFFIFENDRILFDLGVYTEAVIFDIIKNNVQIRDIHFWQKNILSTTEIDLKIAIEIVKKNDFFGLFFGEGFPYDKEFNLFDWGVNKKIIIQAVMEIYSPYDLLQYFLDFLGDKTKLKYLAKFLFKNFLEEEEEDEDY